MARHLDKLLPRRWADLVLAVGVAAMVGIMILPIAPWLMDVFLACNLSAAVALLMVALYAADGMRLPAFPTILLLATLFRLALNVSSTKLILMHGHAGEVIAAFGDIVVGGNYAVGAVVFLVLVLVQFVVIAKGSERVAEVAARFTLDAMPGKQMSIDADLRAGLIREDEARTRRGMLERESKLYGAMDGAMKFVKGDAIAGILISAVNIVGGLIIGVAQQGMAVGEAAEKFTLLTIGDGLVSQIPALLVSISAGLVVTRVASSSDADAGGGRLARDMLEQVLENPRGLIVAGVLIAMVGISGVFPPQLFVPIGAVACAVGIARNRRRDPAAGGAAATGGEAPASAPEQPDFYDVRLAIEMQAALIEALDALDPDRQRELARRFRERVRRLCKRYGIPAPTPVFFPAQRPMLAHGYRFSVDGVRVASGQLPPDRAYVIGDIAAARAAGVEAVPLPLPILGGKVETIPAAQAASAQARGLVVLDPLELLEAHLEESLEKNLGDLLSIRETATLLEALAESRGEFVEAVVPKLLSIGEVTEVLRALLRERVPVRELPRILGALASHEAAGRPIGRTAWVRRELGRTICAELVDASDVLRCFTLTDALEDHARRGAMVDLDRANELRERVAAAVTARQGEVGRAVVVVEEDVREAIADVLLPTLPDIAVLTQAEVPPDTRWQRLAVIGADADAA